MVFLNEMGKLIRIKVDLKWASSVDIYRNSSFLTMMSNTSSYTDDFLTMGRSIERV